MNKFVSCICICLALAVAVMPLCAFKCADVPNAPAMVENMPVMASNRPLVEPVVAPPFMDFVVPDSMVGTWYVNYSLLPESSDSAYLITDLSDASLFTILYGGVTYDNVISLYLSDVVVFIIVVGGYEDPVEITVTSSFYIVIESDGVGVYDDNDNYISPNTVLTSFPDGFLTRVNDSPSNADIVSELIDILVAGIGTFGANIGQGLTDIVVNVFVDTSQETFALTTFGGVIAVFAGLALAVGLSKLVSSFIMRLGGKE